MPPRRNKGTPFVRHGFCSAPAIRPPPSRFQARSARSELAMRFSTSGHMMWGSRSGQGRATGQTPSSRWMRGSFSVWSVVNEPDRAEVGTSAKGTKRSGQHSSLLWQALARAKRRVGRARASPRTSSSAHRHLSPSEASTAASIWPTGSGGTGSGPGRSGSALRPWIIMAR
jgi:hypothetical protein